MKRKRLLAWLLTLAMCFSEIGSTGLKVMAAGEDEVNMEADVDDDIQPDDGAGFVKTAENTMFGTQEMAEARNIMQDGTVWRGSYAYFGEYQGEPVKYRVLSNKTDLYVFKSYYSVLLDCDNLLYTDDWADVKEANETMKSKLHFETLWTWASPRASKCTSARLRRWATRWKSRCAVTSFRSAKRMQK